MSEKSCLFCRIIAGEIPGEMLHQDEQCVVLRDINPQAPMHVLVVPREHLESLDDASQKDEALLGHLLRIGARMANDQGHADSGYRTVINTRGAGQSVFHLHVHVLAGRDMKLDVMCRPASEQSAKPFQTFGATARTASDTPASYFLKFSLKRRARSCA